MTSAPALVTYLPAMTVSAPWAYWPYAWVTSNCDSEVVSNEWMTLASLPALRLTTPPKPSVGVLAIVTAAGWRLNEFGSVSNTRSGAPRENRPVPDRADSAGSMQP